MFESLKYALILTVLAFCNLLIPGWFGYIPGILFFGVTFVVNEFVPYKGVVPVACCTGFLRPVIRMNWNNMRYDRGTTSAILQHEAGHATYHTALMQFILLIVLWVLSPTCMWYLPFYFVAVFACYWFSILISELLADSYIARPKYTKYFSDWLRKRKQTLINRIRLVVLDGISNTQR